MAYGDDIDSLGVDHRWDFDGNANDAVGAANGTNAGGVFTAAALTKDAANSWETNGLTDRVTLPTTATINNAAHARKAVGGWFSTTAFQAPPSRIYGEGTNATCFQFCIGFGNNLIFECTEPANFAEGLQIYGPPMKPGRVYHMLAIFLGSANGNRVKLFVDGIEQSNADPLNRQPDTADLNARGVGEFGDPVGTTGLGGGVVLQQAARNGRYQHWCAWGDSASADLSDSDIRVTLFERGALAEQTITTASQAVMQIAVDALASQPDAPCCIEVEAVSGGGDFTLESDATFDENASIHVRYNGTQDTLTWVNTSGGAASIVSAPFGGAIIIKTRQTLSVTVLDAVTGAAVVGARVYIEAGIGGPLAAGTEIMNATTDGSGLATAVFDYEADQPIVGRVRKASSAPYYKTGKVAGPITSEPLNAVVLMVSDS